MSLVLLCDLMRLSFAQVQQYHREGFLVLPNFVSESECDALHARANEIVQAFDPRNAISIFSTNEQNRLTDDYFLESSENISCFFEEHAFNPDGSLKHAKEASINKIGHALHDLDPIFDSFSRTAKIKSLIESLDISDPLLLQSMYIFKQPHIGGEVTCHQDSTFLYTEPNSIAGLWFALEDATIDNGCLWAIPGGHLQGLKTRWVRTEKGMEFRSMGKDLQTPIVWQEEQLAPLEVKCGTLILLNGLLPHRSFENKSAQSRHAYTLHVISAGANYPRDNWLQRSPSLPLRGF